MTWDDQNVGNLLIRLASYTPREGRSAVEDFTTECLAWLLANSQQFAKKFLGLAGISGDTSPWKASTQVGFRDDAGSKSRFDLVLENDCDPEIIVVVECKVLALADELQIKRYKEAAKAKWKTAIIKTVLLTKRLHSDFDADSSITWGQVHALCLDAGNQAQPASPSWNAVRSWFMDFLNHKNMNDRTMPQLPSDLESVRKWQELEKVLTTVAQDAAKAGLNAMRKPSKRGGEASSGTWIGVFLRRMNIVSNAWSGFKLSKEKSGLAKLECWIEFKLEKPNPGFVADLLAKNPDWKNDSAQGDSNWWSLSRKVGQSDTCSNAEEWIANQLKILSETINQNTGRPSR